MYLLIFESGEIKKARELCNDDFASVDGGVLEIIDISCPSNPKYAVGDGTWREIEDAV